jgi:hypothetical protein
MRGAKFNGRLATKFNPFDEDYLAEILEATTVAWARMEHPKQNEIEDRITFRLAGRLANDPYFAEIPYDVIPQYWLLGLNGQRLGRLDLRFKHRHSRRDYFAFESKRLHVSYPGGSFSTEYSTYAGEKGMMAFVKGYYAKGLPACGMLSYIMDGNSDKAWSGLEKRIEDRRKSLKLVNGSKFAKSVLARPTKSGIKGTHLGETVHDLKKYHLRVFHLLLPVRSTAVLAQFAKSE